MSAPPIDHLLIVHVAGAVGGAERTTNNLLLGLERGLVGSVSLLAMPVHREYWVERYDHYLDATEQGIRGWFAGPEALRSDVAALAAICRHHRPAVILGVMHYGATIAVLAARMVRPRPRVVMSLRGPLYEYLRRYEQSRLRRAALRGAVGAAGLLADQIWVPSSGTGGELVRRFGVQRGKIRVIPNGIDAAAVERALAGSAKDIGNRDGVPLICTVARLASEKRLEQLLEAFALIRRSCPARLRVVGDGPEREALERYARRLGVDGEVEFLGYREQVYPLIAAADVFVHTCEFEGFGYAILEAMACGTPVVATDCPYGPREIIGADRYGVLVPPQEPAALAEAVLGLLGRQQLRAQLEEAGRERARELSVERMQLACGRELAALCAGVAERSAE